MPLADEIAAVVGARTPVTEFGLERARRDQRLVVRRLVGGKFRGNLPAPLHGKSLVCMESYADLCSLRTSAGVSFDASLQAYATLKARREANVLSGLPLLNPLSRCVADAFWENVWQPILGEANEERTAALARRESLATKNKIFSGWYVLFLVSPGFARFQAELQLGSVIAEGGAGAVHQSKDGNVVLDSASVKNVTVGVVCPDPGLARRTVSLPSRSRSYSVFRKEWVSRSLREKKVLSARVYAHPETTPSRPSPVYAAENAWSRSSTTLGSLERRTDPPSVEPTTKRPRVQETAACFRESAVKVAKTLQFPEQNLLPRDSASRAEPQSQRSEVVDISASKFQCQSGVPKAVYAANFPSNALIIELLEKVATFWEVARPKDATAKHRVTNFRKTCGVVRRLEYELLSVEQVEHLVARKDLGFIGNRIGDRLFEIVRTGRLREAEEKEASPLYAPVRELSSIWGVGPATAFELMEMGIKSVLALRSFVKTNPSVIDQNQHIGLAHYEDLLTRIPRCEVDELDCLLKARVNALAPDGSVRTKITGSYIRGRASCGDVDVMVYGIRQEVCHVMAKLIRGLKTDGIITDELVDGDSKYFCVYRLRPGTPHRRLDLFAVPQEEYAFALLTYTGSGKFNRSMRYRARQLGYSLSHKGIHKVSRFKAPNNREEKTICGPSIACAREEDIFSLLGIVYKPPEARDL